MVWQRFCVGAVLGVCLALSPASALGANGGTASRLQVKLVVAQLSTTRASTKDSTTRTCQAGTRQRKTTSKTALIGDTHRVATVACEQPPRSEPLFAPTLEHSVSVALAAAG
jgi:hypothetical protein